MSELSILTILIQAAAIVKNKDGDGSLQGYVERQLTGRVASDEHKVEFAVLDSIGDILLLQHQILAVSGKQEVGSVRF
jgi:hypothetical protein